jgi:hypothetical protein
MECSDKKFPSRTKYHSHCFYHFLPWHPKIPLHNTSQQAPKLLDHAKALVQMLGPLQYGDSYSQLLSRAQTTPGSFLRTFSQAYSPQPNITSHPHLDTANTFRNKSTSTDTRPPKHAQHQPTRPLRAVVSCPSYFAGVAGVAEVPKVVGGEHLAAGRYRNSATTLGPILGLVVNGKVGRRYVLAAAVLEEC